MLWFIPVFIQASRPCSLFRRFSLFISLKYRISLSDVLSQPKQLNKTERDIVTCSIQSNSPLCSYTWKYFNDTESWVESHDLSVELKRPGRITCEVNCTIRHLYCNITPLTIIVLPQGISEL